MDVQSYPFEESMVNLASGPHIEESMVNHILRVHGDMLQREGATEMFDRISRQERDRLFSGLTAEGHMQAMLAADEGGLGWRLATSVARPANLGALVASAPKVRSMAAAAVHAGLLRAGQVEDHLESWTRRVEDAYLDELDEVERVKAEDYLSKARRAAEDQWLAVSRGGGGEVVPAPRADATYGQEISPDLDADPESSSRIFAGPHLQKELAKLQDCTRLRSLEGISRQQSNWPQLQRLQELRHPQVSHQWLWHLDSHRGAVLTQSDYVSCVQKRLGAQCYQGDESCRLCGSPLDPQLNHSEVCATAEATRGHYACVRALVEGLRLADGAVTTEPRGLTSTQARPADILTTAAVPGRSAALDVCIASPDAAAAQEDAAEAAFQRKLHHYRHVIPELAAAGIAFRPMIWTADGRPHPAATRTLHFAAKQAVNRGAGSSSTPKALVRRWQNEVQIAIMRRRAAMARAVLPRPSDRAMWLLTGYSHLQASSGMREPRIEDADGLGELPESVFEEEEEESPVEDDMDDA